ncbi:OmpA family protein [Pseudocolwellia sp. HL-MZ19]|uniref:OmpA family protein n=1 Tax=unclassified Pseudocolwellia TaxID=2848178 RepID=UPI003CEEB079
MNNQMLSISKTNIAVVIFTTILISACAGNRIVNNDAPVEQLKNLNDYDSDGVIKAREKCDETVLGASIDNYGCGNQITKMEPFKINVKFANDSFAIPDLAYDKIKELADFLKENEKIEVVIEGHTSKVGKVTHNQTLSEQRAKAVVLVLIHDFKIPEARLNYVGYGFQRLENEAQTDEAHAANRRIMAELTHTEHFDEMEWTIYSVDQEL